MRALVYSVEVLIGYGPILVLWLVGIGMGLPFSIAGVINGEPIGYLVLFSVLLGSVGIWGIIQLIKKLIWRQIDYPIRRYRNHLIIGCGGVVLASIGFVGVNNFVPIYMVVPILVTWHFYHVCSKNS